MKFEQAVAFLMNKHKIVLSKKTVNAVCEKKIVVEHSFMPPISTVGFFSVMRIDCSSALSLLLGVQRSEHRRNALQPTPNHQPISLKVE